MKKPILISGIQPTGKLHLGNYLGALKNFVELQNSEKYQCYFFIADLHSLTEDFNPQEKPKQVLDLVENFLAAGLDPKKSTIFVQSQIPAHSELAWILNTITPMGELFRMTQFKDRGRAAARFHANEMGKIGEKIKKNEEQKRSNEKFDDEYEKSGDEIESQTESILNYGVANIGLFGYPVLMAADVILYNAQFVPVGEDQLQHLELARTLVRKFNNKFGETFIEPKALLTEVPRLMSLDDPTKKMSKSRPAGCLFLDDSPGIIQEKIKAAVTDSGKEIKYDEQNKPAISNLLLIYSALSGKKTKEIEQEYKNKGYVEFKKDLAEIAINYFKPFQKEKNKLSADKKYLENVLEAGTKKAQKQAQIKIQEIKKKIGLI